jgi:hypothetical protein
MSYPETQFAAREGLTDEEIKGLDLDLIKKDWEPEDGGKILFLRGTLPEDERTFSRIIQEMEQSK